MGKARRLRSRVARQEESGIVSKSKPVAKTKRVLHKEALKQKRGRGLSKPDKFPIWLTQKDKQELVHPKTKLGLASLVDSLDSIEGTNFLTPTTPTVVSSKRRNNTASEALQLRAILEDDRYQSRPFEALQKHLKATVAGSSSGGSLKLKQERAAGSLSAATDSGHRHRKTKKKHHGKIGKLRKPSKNT